MFVKKNTANTNKLRNLPFGTPILFLNSDYDPLPSRLNFVVKLPLDKKKVERFIQDLIFQKCIIMLRIEIIP